ncbi:MAG: hypothetical protein Q8922_02575 [Bacteroidota bacterium]|nr:hypothetical protein [Bacteroidota bacterium]MDP4234749.1 hypothetical protein [Bacteroidota bacterium]MDP4242641.1 hypothetical protein [Bacteroidota bacterium]MDP4286797.1 hypothetical protein [Bacteroidota bacterium]
MKQVKWVIVVVALIAVGAGTGNAQYFQSKPEHAVRQVLKASGRDSVIVDRYTPFNLPAVNDTMELFYHEPLPDSIMPKSAVVLGRVMLQFEYAEDIAPALEKYARSLGADWVVSFQEPRAVLTAEHWKVYRSTATLLRVLDPEFVNQSELEYSYYEERPFNSFADISDFYQAYGRGLAKH